MMETRLIVINPQHVNSQRIQIEGRLKIIDGDGEDEDTILTFDS